MAAQIIPFPTRPIVPLSYPALRDAELTLLCRIIDCLIAQFDNRLWEYFLDKLSQWEVDREYPPVG